MSRELIDLVEQKHLKKDIPDFAVGCTVDVRTRIREGGKERVQVFNGVVIARQGRGFNESFTVRRIVNNEGVERIFMLHSPMVAGIEVRRRGKVRRAKLYFLRERVGKARRLRELRVSKDQGEKAPGAPDAPAKPTPEPVGTPA
jgi:large subunit ribosomal protein L19